MRPGQREVGLAVIDYRRLPTDRCVTNLAFLVEVLLGMIGIMRRFEVKPVTRQTFGRQIRKLTAGMA